MENIPAQMNGRNFLHHTIYDRATISPGTNLEQNWKTNRRIAVTEKLASFGNMGTLKPPQTVTALYRVHEGFKGHP